MKMATPNFSTLEIIGEALGTTIAGFSRDCFSYLLEDQEELMSLFEKDVDRMTDSACWPCRWSGSIYKRGKIDETYEKVTHTFEPVYTGILIL